MEKLHPKIKTLFVSTKNYIKGKQNSRHNYTDKKLLLDLLDYDVPYIKTIPKDCFGVYKQTVTPLMKLFQIAQTDIYYIYKNTMFKDQIQGKGRCYDLFSLLPKEIKRQSNTPIEIDDRVSNFNIILGVLDCHFPAINEYTNNPNEIRSKLLAWHKQQQEKLDYYNRSYEAHKTGKIIQQHPQTIDEVKTYLTSMVYGMKNRFSHPFYNQSIKK